VRQKKTSSTSSPTPQVSHTSSIYVKSISRLTTDNVTCGCPAWGPDGTKIAFHSYRSGNNDIWVMDSDGRNKIRLTTHEKGDYDPAWSPDGTKIAFHSYRSGNNDIWVMDSDGRNKIRLTTHEKGDYDPAWSPDGTKVAFRSYRSGNCDIWVMDSDGRNKLQLTTHEKGDYDPAWSPDGTKIAFRSYRSGNNPDLWVMSLGGFIRPPEPASKTLIGIIIGGIIGASALLALILYYRVIPERKRRDYKSKIVQWKGEGYDVSELEEMLK
jgi:tol-pal system beta propeller repeat protein TolB